jgi:hypothetical protein
MARLPFVVEPKRKSIIESIGSEDSGLIQIERRGYLTAGEKSFVQQVQQFDNGTTEIITVSRRVAREYGLGMDRAYNLVLAIISASQGVNPEDQELIAKIESDFAEQLTAVVKGLAAGQTREDLIYAVCLVKYRIDPTFETDEIAEVHPDIINGLAKLYREEEARSIEAWLANVDEVEDDSKAVSTKSIEEVEKKPVKASVSRSKNTTGD